jgi:hypothetical protein
MGLSAAPAIATDANYFEAVRGGTEAVLLADACEPVVQLAFGQLLHLVAGRADEVMMVARSAEPVAALARAVRKRVDGAAVLEQRERSVDGREADRAPRGP